MPQSRAARGLAWCAFAILALATAACTESRDRRVEPDRDRMDGPLIRTADESVLPPGHPPVEGYRRALPEGHPRLPPGHPPIPAGPLGCPAESSAPGDGRDREVRPTLQAEPVIST